MLLFYMIFEGWGGGGMGNVGVAEHVEYFKTMNHVLHDVDQLAIITLTGL